MHRKSRNAVALIQFKQIKDFNYIRAISTIHFDEILKTL